MPSTTYRTLPARSDADDPEELTTAVEKHMLETAPSSALTP